MAFLIKLLTVAVLLASSSTIFAWSANNKPSKEQEEKNKKKQIKELTPMTPMSNQNTKIKDKK